MGSPSSIPSMITHAQTSQAKFHTYSSEPPNNINEIIKLEEEEDGFVGPCLPRMLADEEVTSRRKQQTEASKQLVFNPSEPNTARMDDDAPATMKSIAEYFDAKFGILRLT